MGLSIGETLLRMGMAALLGGVIGFDRERAGRHAGLRTHIVVSLAAATFMIVSTQFVFHQPYSAAENVNTDPSRIASYVAAGVGFIGAGAIVKTGAAVSGLTTAATVLLVSAVGLAAGGGMYVAAVAATAGSLFTLMALRPLEHKETRKVRRRIQVQGALSRQDLLARLAALGVRPEGFDVERTPAHTALTVDVRFPAEEDVDRVLQAIESLEGVRLIRVERRDGASSA